MSDDMGSRMGLEEFLLTEEERVSLESPAYKGFSFLVGILVESESWERGPVPGQISFEYSPNNAILEHYYPPSQRFLENQKSHDDPLLFSVNVILDLRQTLARNFLNPMDRHLEVIVFSKSTGRSTDACIASNGSAKDTPITDDCSSFVLWGLSGFLDPPLSLISAILDVTDSEVYEKFISRREELLQNLRGLRRQEELLRQLEIERQRNFEDALAINISRLDGMTWPELVYEHRDVGGPERYRSQGWKWSRLDAALYDYRERLLFPSEEESHN